MPADHPTQADTTSEDGGEALPFDGERFVPGVGVGIAYEHLLRYFFAAGLVTGLDVLDVASGEGYGSARLAATARTVVGFDASSAAVAHARRKYVRDNVAYEEASVRSFFGGSAGERFDAVVAFEVIEHLTMDDQAFLLDGIRRVLRPGGFALVSTPDKVHYTDKPLSVNTFHVREYYRDEFEEELRRHFPHVLLLEQAQLTGCAVFPRGAREARLAEMRWTNLVTNEGDCRPEVTASGDYLVAVVAKERLPEIRSCALLDFSRKATAELIRVYRDEVGRLTAELKSVRKAHAEAAEEVARLRQRAAEVASPRP